MHLNVGKAFSPRDIDMQQPFAQLPASELERTGLQVVDPGELGEQIVAIEKMSFAKI